MQTHARLISDLESTIADIHFSIKVQDWDYVHGAAETAWHLTQFLSRESENLSSAQLTQLKKLHESYSAAIELLGSAITELRDKLAKSGEIRSVAAVALPAYRAEFRANRSSTGERRA